MLHGLKGYQELHSPDGIWDILWGRTKHYWCQTCYIDHFWGHHGFLRQDSMFLSPHSDFFITAPCFSWILRWCSSPMLLAITFVVFFPLCSSLRKYILSFPVASTVLNVQDQGSSVTEEHSELEKIGINKKNIFKLTRDLSASQKEKLELLYKEQINELEQSIEKSKNRIILIRKKLSENN